MCPEVCINQGTSSFLSRQEPSHESNFLVCLLACISVYMCMFVLCFQACLYVQGCVYVCAVIMVDFILVNNPGVIHTHNFNQW